MIPKLIHQIWSGKYEPLPDIFRQLGETWKEQHPEWEYRLWSEQDILSFLDECFPELRELYHAFYYDIQRWDAIRYLILYKIGGMYVDFDYECIENVDPLLEGKTCAFAMEPDMHTALLNKTKMFNNALMASVPSHLFLEKVIEKVFSTQTLQSDTSNKMRCVLQTTGPWMLGDLYDEFEDKNSIYLVPAKFVSPFTKKEVNAVINGNISEHLEEKLQEAYAIHYFLGTWL